MAKVDLKRLAANERKVPEERQLVKKPLNKVTRVSTDLDVREYTSLDDYCFKTKRELGKASVTKVAVLRELIRELSENEDLQLAIARRLDNHE